ncbi:MAG: DNA translocase FtsK 4TM domain-containing protein, partial [Eubacteriales bacterium]|nr:DNA translocase FtsK 4TM domain-containing protein [Eubacteriales bacterium]
MATKKKASKKTASGASSARSRRQPVNPPEPAPPIRRELGGVLFFFLAVFTCVSYFNSEGAFVRFFSETIKGLVGWGYWVCVPAFLVITYILFFHRGRPVSLRIFCCLLVPILLSALVSLLIYQYDVTGSDVKRLAELLFDQGKELDSGGVLGGLLAVGLEMAFSIYGAFPVLVVLLGLSLFCIFRSGFKKAA